MILSIIKLILFVSSVQCADNLQPAINTLLPDSPYPPNKRFKSSYQQQDINQESLNNSIYNSNSAKRADKKEWYFGGTGSSNSASNTGTTSNNGNNVTKSSEWFPSLTTSNTNGRYERFNTSNPLNNPYTPNTFNNNSDFQEKLALINPKNYLLTPFTLPRDTKLLSLAHEVLSSASSSYTRPLNILHLGSGTGYVPIALAALSRPVDSIVSLDDSMSNTAKENIYRDGKEIFLNRLKFNQVTSLATALIPRAPNSLPYDLIVSSKAINALTSVPSSLKDALVPRGIIIYPEESLPGSFNIRRRIKVDKIDEYGNLRTIKTVEL